MRPKVFREVMLRSCGHVDCSPFDIWLELVGLEDHPPLGFSSLRNRIRSRYPQPPGIRSLLLDLAMQVQKEFSCGKD